MPLVSTMTTPLPGTTTVNHTSGGGAPLHCPCGTVPGGEIVAPVLLPVVTTHVRFTGRGVAVAQSSLPAPATAVVKVTVMGALELPWQVATSVATYAVLGSSPVRTTGEPVGAGVMVTGWPPSVASVSVKDVA